MLCSGRICGAKPPLGAGGVTRCALAAGGFCPRGTPRLRDGSCLVWHVGCKAGLVFAAIVAAGCRGAPWGAMGCCEPAQCRGHYTAPLPQLSWPVGVWGGSLQLECPLEGTGIKPKPRGASDTRGTEQDMATKPAGPEQGGRNLRFLSPAFSVAQQFGTGRAGDWQRGLPLGRSLHLHFPSQAASGGLCLCDHREVVAVPEPRVPTWSHGNATGGSGLVWLSHKASGGPVPGHLLQLRLSSMWMKARATCPGMLLVAFGGSGWGRGCTGRTRLHHPLV